MSAPGIIVMWRRSCGFCLAEKFLIDIYSSRTGVVCDLLFTALIVFPVYVRVRACAYINAMCCV